MTWRPHVETDLQSLIDSGDAKESHVLDFKRGVGSSDAARKETAADLASFAIDGGSLVIGVDEPSKDRFALCPFDTTGEIERIEQIAANRIRPSLDVRPRVIPSTADPSLGYVVVDIPASPSRPHMVDGRYYGRGEKTRRQLDDAEVRRLMASRRSQEVSVAEALQFERDRYPIGAEVTGRLLMVAIPLSEDDRLAVDFVRRTQADPLLPLLTDAEKAVPDLPSPRPSHTSLETRAEGIARTSLTGGGRTFGDQDRMMWTMDVEVWESGSIRILAGGVVDSVNRNGTSPEINVIRESVVLAWAHRLVLYAQRLSEELGYSGSWGFGAYVDGITGLRSIYSTDFRYWGASFNVWDASTYERIAVAPGPSLVDDRYGIVERLVGRFAAGLGVHGLWPQAFTAPEAVSG